MDQHTIDRAVKIATKAALSGRPVARVVWVPPQSAANDPHGSFFVEEHITHSVADTPPWET